jgi:hypothetical protein
MMGGFSLRRTFVLVFALLSLSTGLSSDAREVRISAVISAVEADANQAYIELKKGADFGSVAEKYSFPPYNQNGGDLGFIDISTMQKELRNAIDSLALNQFSEIEVINEKYYILMKTDERLASEAPIISDDAGSEKSAYDSIIIILVLLSVLLGLVLYVTIMNHRNVKKHRIALPDNDFFYLYADADLGEDIMALKHLSDYKMVIFQYTVSLVFVTFRRESNAYLVPKADNTFLLSLPYTTLSFLLGWWGFPWGPIETVPSIYRNLRGGITLELENLDHALSNVPKE